MSILDQNNEQPSRAKVVADRLVDITKRTFSDMTVAFNEGAFLFWNGNGGAEPTDIAAELGTNAAEIFYLHARLGELLALVKPDSITQALAVVGEFTVNDDGTVTVVVPEPDVVPSGDPVVDSGVVPSGDPVEPEVVPSGDPV
jgi:hypothetical protein